ncbi:MAG: hypothetical protein AVDCRST_MAG36-286 [uncultured Nocardioidaceae bacterium]|uniref:Uncharacterized protein n=1 Tax=uncultured Nocardioidaceae bacterium TaxID=253824 RepID=A0A6J4KZA2_9ACTN|nr:MAG: hypothetical protein AVDCRST_MAG36-286 [uncultured Nocardioidaceae bacterium]
MTPRCEECGTELQQATIDLAETPDVDPSQDRARAEFDAQHMAAVAFCPNPGCSRQGRPGDAEDSGARV